MRYCQPVYGEVIDDEVSWQCAVCGFIGTTTIRNVGRYCDVREPPTIAELIATYRRERKAWIDAGKPLRTPAQIQECEAICNSCPAQFFTLGKERCRDCGCFLNVARQWATKHCPRGKWPGDPPAPAGGCGGCGKS